MLSKSDLLPRRLRIRRNPASARPICEASFRASPGLFSRRPGDRLNFTGLNPRRFYNTRGGKWFRFILVDAYGRLLLLDWGYSSLSVGAVLVGAQRGAWRRAVWVGLREGAAVRYVGLPKCRAALLGRAYGGARFRSGAIGYLGDRPVTGRLDGPPRWEAQ